MGVRKVKPPAFVSDADRRAALRLKAERAAEWFATRGDLPAWWNTREITGAMIAHGLVGHAALAAAGLNVPRLKGGENAGG